jgi:hypothetical protein
MERKTDIEDQINAALQSAKSIEPSDLPYGFSERVANRLHSQNNVRRLYNIAPLLRVAAVFVIIIINVLTLRLTTDGQPKQTATQYVTLKDFVNEYQINDASEELLTTNIPTHEQSEAH